MLIKRLKEARLRSGLSQYKPGVLAGLDEASESIWEGQASARSGYGEPNRQSIRCARCLFLCRV